VATRTDATTAAAPGDPVRKPLAARQRQLSEFTPRDRVVRSVLGVFALLPAAALVFLAYQMFKLAYPAIVFSGWHFFSKSFTIGNQYGTGSLQDHHGYKAQPGASFGVLEMLFGTVVSSGIALVIAVPVSVGGAIFLVERLPLRYQGTLGAFLELLAGIPSIVFGLWGYLTFGPFLARDVYPAITDLGIPWFKGPVNNGQSVATASLVLAVMIIPIIASTTRELIRSVPELTKEGAVALGLTPSESVRLVTMPFVRTGIVAASILGLARALGETVAVLFISGASLSGYPHSIFAQFSTMAASIANILDAALTDGTGMALHALAEVGLLLLVITLIANFGGRLIATRLGGGGLPVGRGV
jgi:phosphate transport system permease protein